MKYRTKPCEIEAVQWTSYNHREMYDFLTGDVDGYMQPSGDNFYIDHDKVKGGLVIKTLEGEHIASIGDYIIKGLVGEFYPCKEEVFLQKYERIEAILVYCPHCGGKRYLTELEIEEVWNGGKTVITDCNCGKLFTVEDDGDCIFTH